MQDGSTLVCTDIRVHTVYINILKQKQTYMYSIVQSWRKQGLPATRALIVAANIPYLCQHVCQKQQIWLYMYIDVG